MKLHAVRCDSQKQETKHHTIDYNYKSASTLYVSADYSSFMRIIFFKCSFFCSVFVVKDFLPFCNNITAAVTLSVAHLFAFKSGQPMPLGKQGTSNMPACESTLGHCTSHQTGSTPVIQTGNTAQLGSHLMPAYLFAAAWRQQASPRAFHFHGLHWQW